MDQQQKPEEAKTVNGQQKTKNPILATNYIAKWT